MSPDELNMLIDRIYHGHEPSNREAESLAHEIQRQRRIVNEVIYAIGDNELVDGPLVKRLLSSAT